MKYQRNTKYSCLLKEQSDCITADRSIRMKWVIIDATS